MLTRACSVLMLVLLIGSTMMSFANGKIDVAPFGSIDGEQVQKLTLKNKNGYEVDVISYGATITAVRVPDRQGNIADVVLGFDNVEGYLSKDNPYFGATIGRVANRIKNGKFTVDGAEYHISKNIGNNSLHGGEKGWNSKIWNTSIENDRVVMTLLSEDGAPWAGLEKVRTGPLRSDHGYPGAVIASVAFGLTDSGELIIEMKSFTTKATPINLTNHSYFNLAGHGTNAEEIYKHKITINADRWTVTDSESIPTGEIRSVENSVMDLRNLTTLGDVINKVPGGGYDYNFCLPEGSGARGNRFVAKAIHPDSGRYLEVYSNQPGVQFYTANFLPDASSKGVSGKNGKEYFKHGAFCLETQNYPDAINHSNFPDSVLRPGHVYLHTVTYKFGIQD